MKDLHYLHAFRLLGIGNTSLQKLKTAFNSWQTAFSASPTLLIEAGLEPQTAARITEKRDHIDIAKEALTLEQLGITLLSQSDDAYPKLLAEISDPPLLLYIKGTLQADSLNLSVVGTRKISPYAGSIMPRLLNPLADAGVTIVSGLALGVDGQAHTLAVEQQKPTIAVLGTGLDTPSLYPQLHRGLAEQILTYGGCLISEYPPGTKGLKHHFIARNRIIAGLSPATLVVECGAKSGSLITARYALEYGREVLAVPGPITAEASEGTNNLLKMGATPITSATDLLTALHITHEPTTTSLPPLNQTERVILSLLQNQPLHINTIISQSTLESSHVTTTLTYLEMKGLIKNVGANQYVRI